MDYLKGLRDYWDVMEENFVLTLEDYQEELYEKNKDYKEFSDRIDKLLKENTTLAEIYRGTFEGNETLSSKECKALYQFFELLECKYALELQNL